MPSYTQGTLGLFKMLNCSFGSLWWVNDKLWKERIPTFHEREDREEENQKHPGVALEAEGEEYKTEIPMILGTSNKQRQAFVTTGITGDENHETFFRLILPCPTFGYIQFVAKENRIERNDCKKRLDSAECARLKAYVNAQLYQ